MNLATPSKPILRYTDKFNSDPRCGGLPESRPEGGEGAAVTGASLLVFGGDRRRPESGAAREPAAGSENAASEEPMIMAASIRSIH